MNEIIEQVANVLKGITLKQGISIETQIELPIEILEELPIELFKEKENVVILILSKLLEILQSFEKLSLSIFFRITKVIQRLIDSLSNEKSGEIIPGIVSQFEVIRNNGRSEQVIECMKIIKTIIIKSFNYISSTNYHRLEIIINKWFIQKWKLQPNKVGEFCFELIKSLGHSMKQTIKQLKEVGVKANPEMIIQLDVNDKNEIVECILNDMIAISNSIINWINEKVEDKIEEQKQDSDIRYKGRELLNQLVAISWKDEIIKSQVIISSQIIGAIEVIIFERNESLLLFQEDVERRIIDEIIEFNQRSDKLISVLNRRKGSNVIIKEDSKLNREIEQKVIEILISKGKENNEEIKDQIIEEIIKSKFKRNAKELLCSKKIISSEQIISILLDYQNIQEMKEIIQENKKKIKIQEVIKVLSNYNWSDIKELQIINIFINETNELSEELCNELMEKVNQNLPIMIDNDEWIYYLFILIKNILKKYPSLLIESIYKLNEGPIINENISMNINSMLNIIGINNNQIPIKSNKEERKKNKERNTKMNIILQNCLIGLTHYNSNIKNEAICILKMNIKLIKKEEIIKVMNILKFTIETELENENLNEILIINIIELINISIITRKKELNLFVEHLLRSFGYKLLERILYIESTPYNKFFEMKQKLFEMLGHVFNYCFINYENTFDFILCIIRMISCKRFFLLPKLQQKNDVDMIVILIKQLSLMNSDVFNSIVIPLSLKTKLNKTNFEERYSRIFQMLFGIDYKENQYFITQILSK
ncbi:hypothetical protein ENUP19_0163G0007 [Entamoeba nuttalli]|uniref:Uncharacterized protein n=2 Tax=Entamoeba nuttalli TaxID=412467 RepID=K2I0R7_ENTNP|nr:hypothetical protein ENU1_023730 [Entamoeba nuttalli P19]EKE42355.1 hypothetical protein ENU1_023730 [Entamoeba nuttalli P19]|eukprot:XP_008855304.1 hypothetical protein ENU1_023730 [Entamoeba nuttalli P19]